MNKQYDDWAKECKGCMMEESCCIRYTSKLNKMEYDCPCTICLVKVTCKENGCPEFNKFFVKYKQMTHELEARLYQKEQNTNERHTL